MITKDIKKLNKNQKKLMCFIKKKINFLIVISSYKKLCP